MGASHGFTHQWVAVVSVIVNSWGGLDALLRFPKVPVLTSCFAQKQLLLLALKTFAYVFGTIGSLRHICIFNLLFLINTWGLPLMYLIALPLDADEVAVDEDDVDILVKLWQLATC